MSSTLSSKCSSQTPCHQVWEPYLSRWVSRMRRPSYSFYRCIRYWRSTSLSGWLMRTSSLPSSQKPFLRRLRHSYSKWCVRSQNHRKSTCKTSSHHCPSCATLTGEWMSKSVQGRRIEWSRRRCTSKWTCSKIRRAKVTIKINRSCSRLAKDSWRKCWRVSRPSTLNWRKWQLPSNEQFKPADAMKNVLGIPSSSFAHCSSLSI